MIMHIADTNTCWVCGKDNNIITRHHVLPKHLNPVNNVIVPVCEGCHDRINADDVNGMYAYLHKVSNTIHSNKKMVSIALGKINDMVTSKEESKK